MAINFPNSPTLDDEYTDPTTDIVWKWDGSSWERIFEDFNFSQKIGIGTVDPQEEIHVKAQVPVIRLEDTDGGYMQIVGSDGNIRFDADNDGSISGSNISFNIDNTQRMIIDASGNLSLYGGNISSGNTKTYIITSGSLLEYFYIGKLEHNNGIDGYANITIYNCVDTGEVNSSRLEVQINQRDGHVVGNAILYGTRVSGQNVDVLCFADQSTSASSDNISIYVKSEDYCRSIVSVVHYGGYDFQMSENSVGSSTPSGTMIFDSSANIDFTVTQTGNVGIGETAPSSKLDIGLTSSFNKISGKYIDYRSVGNGTNEGYLLLVPASTTSAGKFVGTIVADRGNINNGNENMKAHFNVSVAYNVNRGMLELFGNADHYFKKLVIVTFSGVDYIAAYFNQTGGGPANGIFVEDAIVAGLDANCLTMKYGSEINATVDSNFGSIVSNISGNVGIGITSPASELDVDGVIRAGNATSTDGGTALRVKYQSTGDHTANFGAAQSSGAPMLGYCVESHQTTHDTFVSTADNASHKRAALVVGSDLEFWNGIGQSTAVGSNASMVRRFIVNESGNVGIGTAASTANPTSKLHVSGPNTDIVAGLISSTDVDLSMIAYQSSHAEIRVSSNHHLLFKTNGNNERMRITNDGNVEIGTSSTSVDLKVNNNTVYHTGNFTPTWTSGTNLIHYTSGNVGIGTSTPSEKLHVDGDSFIDGVLKLKPKQISSILTAHDADSNDHFGTSVAISGDGSVLAVGSTGFDHTDSYGVTDTQAGAVYIYDWNGYSWIQRGSTIHGAHTYNELYGSSVSLSYDGSVLAVGAEHWDDFVNQKNNTGIVRVYDRNSYGWSQRGSHISGSSTNQYLGSGITLSADGNTIIIGSRGKRRQYPFMGAWHEGVGEVETYNWESNSWTLKNEFYAGNDTADLVDYNYFGSSVSLSSDGLVLAVGAYAYDTVEGGTNNYGAVYIYDKSGDWGWSKRGSVLTPNPPQADQYFGLGVSLSSDGSVLVVSSAHFDVVDDSGNTISNQGVVYIYDRDGDSWTLRGTFHKNDGEQDDYFGSEVSLTADGSALVIGSSGWDDFGNVTSNRGGVYTYSIEANSYSFPTSVSNKGYGLNVLDDSIILNCNNVGIGTYSPDTTLHITQNGPAVLRLESGVTSLNSNDIIGSIEFESRDSTSGSTGVVGKIDVISEDAHPDASMIFFTSKNNIGSRELTEKMRINSQGNVICTGTVTQNSDITLKENLEVIKDPIEKVKQINGYTFNMIDNQEEKMVGLVAQEVEEILPELVLENHNGIKSLAYGNIVALLVECIKKQDERIESQDEKIKDLEKTIQELS